VKQVCRKDNFKYVYNAVMYIMIKPVKKLDLECIDDLDLEVEKEMEQCVVQEGEKCYSPITKFKIEGYQFQCDYDGCHKEFIESSKEKIIERAEEHMARHLE